MAADGKVKSAVDVAKIIASMSEASKFAFLIACCPAMMAIFEVVSSLLEKCLCRIPLRVTIHSSLVLSVFSNSEL